MAAVILGVASVASAISTSGNLADLAGREGGSLSIGDKVFSDFGFHAVGLTSFDASEIQVTASIGNDGVYYLTWNGNIGLAGIGVQVADLLLSYTVTANPGSIVMIDQNYTGSTQYGALAIDETAKIDGGAVVGFSHLQVGDLSDPDLDPFNAGDQNDILNINPAQHVLYVTKDISLAIAPPEGQIGLTTISQVQQSFHQTTVPDGGSTLILLGATFSGLAGLGLYRKKV